MEKLSCFGGKMMKMKKNRLGVFLGRAIISPGQK